MLTGRGRWWEVVSTVGSAAELHKRPLPAHCDRLVWSHRVEASALVLGSTQPESDLNRAATTGLEVVRRRSGGGAVLVRPDDTWIDVLIGRDDELWSDDVGRAFYWLGQVWERSFRALDVECTMHRGALDRRNAGRAVCFAGLGPGELIDQRGRKLLGLSQRRTRNVARFQCLVPTRNRLGETAELLNPEAIPAGLDFDTEIGSTLDPSVLTTTFLSELARLP
ncbi:MAG: lipoyl protein ligase domain-containing protein [Acidimicrobiales bacterium]